MALYIWKCDECRLQIDTTQHVDGRLDDKGHRMRRDYRAEGVGFTGVAEFRRQREAGLDGDSGKRQLAETFLPTAEDMKGPDDPTGQKGLAKWNDEHGPKEGNKRPFRPVTEKRTF